MRQFLKKLTNKSKYGILVKSILYGKIAKPLTGSTHKHMDLRQSLEYITKVFEDYMVYGELSEDDIENKTILEIGPGDNLGVALKLIASGAKKVICLDRFYCERDDKQQAEIYKVLLESMEHDQRERALQAVLIEDDKVAFNTDKIEYISGVGIESAEKLLAPETIDIIVSRAVLQYVEDLDKVFDNMNNFLKKDGRLIHKIDLRDHGMFSNQGMSPMEFLTVPDFIWKFISPHASKTNRCRINYYRDKLAQHNYNFKLYLTHIMGYEDQPPYKLNITESVDYTADDLRGLSAIRPRLLKRFQSLSDEDLLVSGIFLAARKEKK